MPERIQRRRVKGFVMPAEAIYVGRPTKWGNPWRVVGAGTEPGLFGGRERVFTVDGPGNFFRGTYAREEASRLAVSLFREWVNHWPAKYRGWPDPLDVNCGLRELRGHDLACWCPLTDQHGNRFPCHADVLLQIANPEEAPADGCVEASPV